MDADSLAVELACQQFQFLARIAVAAVVLKHLRNVQALRTSVQSPDRQGPVLPVFVDHRRGNKIYHERQQFQRKNVQGQPHVAHAGEPRSSQREDD